MSYSPKGSGELRQLMEGFIQERLQSKIEKLSPDDPRYEKLTEQFQFSNWIEDAARRVSQLQVVTHSLKAIHPDAKGTNLYAPPSVLTQHALVGSHLLTSDFDSDVVGNAAALDVYKFLRLQHNGETLLNRALSGCADFKAALTGDNEAAEQLTEAFASITTAKVESTSHSRAKQLYWLAHEDPTDNNEYHLLAPLYATSLAHSVFKTINHDRFSEESKAARKAKKDNHFSDVGYRVYADMASQKLGGTKPQNISQLNSERGGNNYLLASLPPTWQSPHIAPVLNSESAFYRFNRRPDVKAAFSGLVRFLNTDPNKDMYTRNYVDELLDALIEQLVLFTSEIRQLQPGWSDDSDCRLPEFQKHWLDPSHYNDVLTSPALANDTWPHEVVENFARWLNNKLRKTLPVGDPEHTFWKKRLEKKLNLLQEELPYV